MMICIVASAAFLAGFFLAFLAFSGDPPRNDKDYRDRSMRDYL